MRRLVCCNRVRQFEFPNYSVYQMTDRMLGILRRQQNETILICHFVIILTCHVLAMNHVSEVGHVPASASVGKRWLAMVGNG
jgi:hypothetical protein